jgi:hypothetical protein
MEWPSTNKKIFLQINVEVQIRIKGRGIKKLNFLNVMRWGKRKIVINTTSFPFTSRWISALLRLSQHSFIPNHHFHALLPLIERAFFILQVESLKYAGRNMFQNLIF